MFAQFSPFPESRLIVASIFLLVFWIKQSRVVHQGLGKLGMLILNTIWSSSDDLEPKPKKENLAFLSNQITPAFFPKMLSFGVKLREGNSILECSNPSFQVIFF